MCARERTFFFLSFLSFLHLFGHNFFFHLNKSCVSIVLNHRSIDDSVIMICPFSTSSSAWITFKLRASARACVCVCGSIHFYLLFHLHFCSSLFSSFHHFQPKDTYSTTSFCYLSLIINPINIKETHKKYYANIFFALFLCEIVLVCAHG